MAFKEIGKVEKGTKRSDIVSEIHQKSHFNSGTKIQITYFRTVFKTFLKGKLAF